MSQYVIDITRLIRRLLRGRLPTGVDRVGMEYVRHFHDRSIALIRAGLYWNEMSPEDSHFVFNGLLSPSQGFRRRMRLIMARSYWPMSRPRTGSSPLLFNTGHAGLEQPGYAQQLQRSGVAPLFFIHDLIPITHPEYCRSGEEARHRRRINTALALGAGIIANSEATLAELVDYAKKTSRALPPTVVAPLAPARLPRPATQAPLPHPYFVMLGTIEPRKNHALVLQIWRRLVERLGHQAPRLVLIGQRGWEYEHVLDLLERCQALRGIVLERSSCSDAELSTYLGHARALLFPSFAEGYGLPLVESLSLGVPVIASDLPAFREIAGDIPDYLDPLDGLGWMARILEYARPWSVDRARQIERLRHYQAPDWAAHFEVVEHFLTRLRVSGQ